MSSQRPQEETFTFIVNANIVCFNGYHRWHHVFNGDQSWHQIANWPKEKSLTNLNSAATKMWKRRYLRSIVKKLLSGFVGLLCDRSFAIALQTVSVNFFKRQKCVKAVVFSLLINTTR